jgi:hypothetical protein
MDRMTAETIKAEAVRQGMTTLRQSGWEKVLAGITTPEEVMETTEADGPALLASETPPDFPKETQNILDSGGGADLPSALILDPKPVGRKKPDLKCLNARKFQRMACDIPVHFRIVNYQGAISAIRTAREKLALLEFEGHTRDISAGGVYFSICDQLVLDKSNIAGDVSFPLGQALESGSILEIEIMFPNGGKAVKCMAKILRVSKSLELVAGNEESFCRVGASFLALDSEDRCRLLKFLEVNKEPHEAV